MPSLAIKLLTTAATRSATTVIGNIRYIKTNGAKQTKTKAAEPENIAKAISKN